MGWNAILGLLPFLLASILFVPKRHRNLFWAIGFILFILFLPNAPYIFTDIIHLPTDIAGFTSKRAVVAFTWQYLLLIAIGYWLFCRSYFKFENFVFAKYKIHYRVWIRIISFLIISIGVYLGRFPRFNSWDAFTKPHEIIPHLITLTEPASLAFVGLFTILLYSAYVSYEALHLQKEKLLITRKIKK